MGVATWFDVFRRWARSESAASVACLSLTLTLCASLAHAQSDAALSQDASPVVTTVDPCVPVDLVHFRRLLSIELGTSIDYQPAAPREPGRTWVHVACSQLGIVLQLEDGVTGKSMARTLDASEIEPADSTRLLALAVAEFVVASWVELRAVPRPSIPAVGATPPTAAPAQFAAHAVLRKLEEVEPPLPAGDVTPFEAAIGIGIDTFTSHKSVLPTGSLRLQISLAPVAFALGGDIGYLAVPVTRESVRAGTIDVIRGTGLAAVLFGGEVEDFALWAGPAVRFGVLRMASKSELPMLDGKRVMQAHGGVGVLARLNHRFASHFSAGVELELGTVTLPVQAVVEDKAILEFSGAWFSAGLRASLVF